MKSNFFILKAVQVILIICTPFLSFGQNNELATIKEKIDANKGLDGEKMFVHIDKQTYFPGEVLWFKIYDVSASTNKPSQSNQLAYVELLNRQNEPVLQAKVQLTKGLGSGSFYLPSSLASDQYLFRAYTNQIKTQDATPFFERGITVVNLNKNITASTTKLAYDLQFFPEGGQIVNGIPTKVAFKLTNQFGKGVDFEGVVLDQEEQIVKEIKSLKFGIGSFNLAPMPDKKYKVKVYLKSGQIIEKNLPTILAEGYGLNVTDLENGQLKIKVAASKNRAGQQGYLLIHSKKGGVKFAEALSLKYNNATEFIVDEQKLDEGISEITLFNQSLQPVSERLYFKRPLKTLTFKLSKNKDDFAHRQLVDLNLQAIDKDEKPLQANLSISVYKTDSLQQQNDNEGIFDYLWLSSELKGKIESASYYFAGRNTERNQALDNLMLTHGWRKFNSNPAAENTPVLTLNANTKTYQILGHVTSKNGTPIADVVTYLSLPGKNTNLYIAKTNEKGIASFEVKEYYGPAELIFQTNDPRRTDFNLQLINPFYTGQQGVKLAPAELEETLNETILTNSIAVQVQNSFTEQGNVKFDIPKADDTPFFYKPYKTYSLDDFTRFRTMEEVLKEYVAQATLRKTGNDYHLFLLDANRGYHFEKEPLILFDGIPVFNTNKIVAYDPLKIKNISIVNKRYYYGPLVAEGIINFITYNNDAAELQLDPQAIMVAYDGLQAKREFYAPKYDTSEQVTSRMPDFRTLLQWMPEMKTDGEGKVNFKFYTSDLEGNFKIVINGLTADGSPANYTSEFKVIK